MPAKSKIQDQTFLFTGTLTEFTREEAEALVEQHGGKVLSTVTAKLNYLVVGEEAGSKLEKAKKLGTVKILKEKEFLKMVPTSPVKNVKVKVADSESKSKTSKTSTPAQVETDMSDVQIGQQVWMTKNLNVLKFRNGDDIPLIKSDKDWKACYDSKKPACCFINNDPKTAPNGLLYNWFAVNDKRGLAPKGYAVPTLDDWKMLIGNQDPKKVGKILKSKEGWKNGAKNSNATGLSITPNETRMFGEFSNDSDSASFWTSTQAMDSYAMSFDLAGKNDKVDYGSVFMDSGLAVRCLKK